MPQYRVQVIGLGGEVTEQLIVEGHRPDDAAVFAVGIPLVRGAKGMRKVLRAKVYWESHGKITMARFYIDDERLAHLREA
jgi:hypothetical protein